MDLMNYWSWILWIFSRLNKYLLGLLLECNLLFTASGTFSGGGGNDKSFSLVDSYLSASQNACCLLVLWAALNPCQERDLARPPVVPESPLGGGWEGGGLDNLSFTALIEKNFIMNLKKNLNQWILSSKSNSLQYNTLGQWVISSTKNLTFQVFITLQKYE